VFLFLLFERVFTADFKWLFEESHSENRGKKDLQESSSLGNNTELKINANPE